MKTNADRDLLNVLKLNDIDSICEYYKEHPNIEYSSAEDIFAVAAALYQKCLFSECTEFVARYSTIVCQDPNFCALVGSAYRKILYFEKALEVYQAGLFICSDSLALKNNLANLFIDMRRFDKCEDLLIEILRVDPDYIDAKENLKRLYLFKAQNTNSLVNEVISSDSTNINDKMNSSIIQQFDPLLNAFSSAEAIVYSSNDVTSSAFMKNSLVLDEILRGVEESVDTNLATELLSVARSFNSIDPLQGLEQCNACYRKFGAYPPIYQVAGEAHLILGNFDKAKGYFLTCLYLGHKNITLFLNLASISISQNDVYLHNYWFNQAELLDSKSDVITNFKVSVASAVIKANVSGYKF